MITSVVLQSKSTASIRLLTEARGSLGAIEWLMLIYVSQSQRWWHFYMNCFLHCCWLLTSGWSWWQLLGWGRCHLLFEMHHIKAEGTDISPTWQTWQWLVLLFWHDKTWGVCQVWRLEFLFFFSPHKKSKKKGFCQSIPTLFLTVSWPLFEENILHPFSSIWPPNAQILGEWGFIHSTTVRLIW